jgi:hypothetical protein
MMPRYEKAILYGTVLTRRHGQTNGLINRKLQVLATVAVSPSVSRLCPLAVSSSLIALLVTQIELNTSAEWSVAKSPEKARYLQNKTKSTSKKKVKKT